MNTKQTQALSVENTLKQALEALETIRQPLRINTSLDAYDVGRAIIALREAMAEQPATVTVKPNPPLYSGGYFEGVMAERERIVNLLMIQHEAAQERHNYWLAAAKIVQADVGSNK